ncbi:DUF3927 domain-containing protein [Salmonella enterica subsp. enterica serovar Enteritidis]|nr:DUF3927 domain-containing protein [Salmonella enterica]EBF8731404.1 DUF3927 domain-containing protein [Salmonella enterica subsp. enterica]EBY7908252.1 DUF3927 domain-containing protein [Salmonella enterica subsp. enterica serovar Enteritidis]ECG0119576.1 DUF3927 domain-containing protein [Salmonella enterica subsp. enterica serovar Schwarzengrund]EDQ6475107.1 DUF3927 domain-containing protein [Salmonella enterica subsp. enterica serovar Braenderup]HBY9478167.1 DUF3927 domain-containing pro
MRVDYHILSYHIVVYCFCS